MATRPLRRMPRPRKVLSGDGGGASFNRERDIPVVLGMSDKWSLRQELLVR